MSIGGFQPTLSSASLHQFQPISMQPATQTLDESAEERTSSQPGRSASVLQRSQSDSFLLRYTEPETSPSIQDIIAPLIPGPPTLHDTPESVLEQPADSRRLQTAIVHYKAASKAGLGDRPDFARQAERSFLEAVSDFSVPYHRALCHIFAASSAQLANREHQTVNHHTEQALENLSAHTDYIQQYLSKLQSKNQPQDEQRYRLNAIDEAVNLLSQNQGIYRILQASHKLHDNPAALEQQSTKLAARFAQLSLQVRQTRQTYEQEHTQQEATLGCTVQ
jgi:hypothetical protein